MFRLFAMFVVCLSLTSCMVGTYEYPDYPTAYQNGTVTFCDDYGCREVTGHYYYDANGAVVYYDDHFGYWVGPHGYWLGASYRSGYWGGYHGYYHRGFYRGGGYYHGGGYYRGGGHYNHGGGHRR